MTDKKTMMENLVREAHEKGCFTGTWLFAENGEIVSEGAIGWRDPEDTLPMQEDTVFYLASVSKQFTAAAVMLLRCRGLLHLEDEITKFFPEIPYRGVTIRHLLNHTGGLPDYFPWVDQLAKEQNVIPANSIIVRFLCECGKEPAFAPGEKYEYSNTGYCLLAQIVEQVSGISFEKFMQDNIFEPAGMSVTHVCHRRKDGLTIDNFARGMYLELGSDRYLLPDDSEESDYAVSVDGMSGGGAVHSNIPDLLAWDRALREEKVLTREEQMLMYTPGLLNDGRKVTDEDGNAYGFGWVITEDPGLGLVVSHSGGMPGYSTWYERFPDADRVLILLCCRDAVDARIYRGFRQGMRDIAGDRESKPILSVGELEIRDPDRSGWDEFCGKYDYFYDDLYIDEIFMKDGMLCAKARCWKGPGRDLKLYPLKERTFGIRRVSGDLVFGDGCFTLQGVTGRKCD